MNRIKKLFRRFDDLPARKKMQLVTAMTLTFCLMISIPSFAWFNEQKKAAEMFKIEYPNALYVNAAHREDRVFLDLGAINVNANVTDEFGNDIYYSKSTNQPNYQRDDQDQIMTNEDGSPKYITEPELSYTKKIDKKQYVFSVSGSGTRSFTLQLAHTTNNQFTYKVYDATQYRYNKGTTGVDEAAAVPSGANDEDIVKYNLNENSHTENKLVVSGDEYNDPTLPSTLYYVKGSDIEMEAKNKKEVVMEGASYSEVLGKTLSDESKEKYYTETYAEYTNVHKNAVPIYWQKNVNLRSDEIDENNRTFCKYYILEVTWNTDQQASIINKETDMVYLSVDRGNG